MIEHRRVQVAIVLLAGTALGLLLFDRVRAAAAFLSLSIMVVAWSLDVLRSDAASREPRS